MATLFYSAGWSASGSAQSMTVNVTGQVATAVVATTYSHITFASLVTGYAAFAAAVKVALDAGGGGPYTVSFSTTTLMYTISRGTNFAWDTAVGSDTALRMRYALGLGTGALSGLGATGTPYISTVRPYYLAVPLIVGRSEFSDVYEPDDISEEAVSDGGQARVVSKNTTELWSDWVQTMEAKGAPSGSLTTGGVATLGCATMTRSVSSTFPWSWQMLYKHVRGQHPFGVYESATANTLHQLRADGTSFAPDRYAKDLDTQWMIPFRTRDLGVLP